MRRLRWRCQTGAWVQAAAGRGKAAAVLQPEDLGTGPRLLMAASCSPESSVGLRVGSSASSSRTNWNQLAVAQVAQLEAVSWREAHCFPLVFFSWYSNFSVSISFFFFFSSPLCLFLFSLPGPSHLILTFPPPTPPPPPTFPDVSSSSSPWGFP